MLVYITKYALRTGIQEHDVTQSVAYPQQVHSNSSRATYTGEGVEWHRTIESAIERAEAMRKEKIVALEKSLKTMKSLDFKKGCI